MSAKPESFRCADCTSGVGRKRDRCAQQYRDGELACHDCGLIYGGPGWIDTTIPPLDWALISPTGGHGGILCVTCMARRINAAGRREVPLLVGSGPFVTEAEVWFQHGFEGGRRAERESAP